MNKLAESHLLIIVRVDHLKKVVNFFFIGDHLHPSDQVSELLFIDHSIVISVNGLEDDDELFQELFVLFQLEIEDYLLKVVKRQSFVVSLLLSDHLLFSSQFLRLGKGVIVRLSLLILDHKDEFLLEDLIVILIIHFLDDRSPLPLFQSSALSLLHHSPNLRF